MKKIIYGFIVFNLLTFHVKETNACRGESCDICHERLTWFRPATPALRNAHKTTAMISTWSSSCTRGGGKSRSSEVV